MKGIRLSSIAPAMTFGIVVLGGIVGCATNQGSIDNTSETVGAARRAPERVSFRHEEGALASAVRAIGEQCGGGIVLMSGLEELSIGAVKVDNAPYETLVRRIAHEAGLLYQATPDYYFLYPSGYESLAAFSIGGQVNAAPVQPEVSVSFGAGTKLYNVFAVLSHMLGFSIVADNALAETVCGELFVAAAPFGSVLDAILKSARTRQDAVAVETTSEYVFIRYSANEQPVSLLLNEASLDAPLRELLERRVTVYLPEVPPAGGQVYVFHAGKSLQGTLDVLSRQVGLRVHADPEVAALPVNPVVFINVRLRTALDLLVRQWPLPEFGYELRDDGIHIRRR